MIKLIIFDLDGTLIDSSQDITDAINHAINGLGLPGLSEKDTINLLGEGITRLIEKLLTPNHLMHNDRVLKDFLDHYSSHLTDNTKPYPFVPETLEKMNNFKKAVVSNKRELLSIEILDKLGLLGHFDIVMGSDSVNDKKPSPAPIHFLLEKFSLEPGMAVIVGDSDIDIRTGKAAGIRSIGVTYGYRPEEALKGADHIIDDIRELERVVTMLL